MTTFHHGSARKRNIRPLALAAVLLALAGSAGATIISFGAIARGATDSDGDGSFDTLMSPANYLTGIDTFPRSRPTFRWALEFDLASLPAGALIQSATLGVATARPDLAGQTLLSGYLGDGTISLADMSAGSALLTFTPTTIGLEPQDVSAFVQGAFGPAQSWIGFNLRRSPLGNQYTVWLGPENQRPPVLTIEYSVNAVPEPQAIWLALAALGAMAGASWPRRRPD